MMQVFKSVIPSFLIWTGAAAQTLVAQQLPGNGVESLLLDSRWRELIDQQSEREVSLVERQHEQQSEQKFMDSMRRFVLLWNRFAKEYNEKKVFNMKLAKEVSKTFRSLESTAAWPNAARKR